MTDLVHYRKDGALSIVTLADPKRHNTLTLELMQVLTKQLLKIAEARDTVVVIIEGDERVFSAGHHLGEIQNNDLQGVHKLFEQSYALKKTLRDMPQIVVAKIRGIAVAAGLELVAAADLAVAEEGSKFGTTGINWGLFCSTPSVFLSKNVLRKKAVEMLFTGRLFSAEEAFAMGLVNAVAPVGQLDDVTYELARSVARHHLEVVALGKKMFYEQWPLDDWKALSYATEVIIRNSKMPETIQGIQAFLDKKEPQWQDGVTRITGIHSK